MLAAAVNLLQVASARRFVEASGHVVAEQLGEAEDRVEGRAELVAHAREELALGVVGGGQLFGALFNLGLELARQKSLVLHEAGVGDGARRARREALQQLDAR